MTVEHESYESACIRHARAQGLSDPFVALSKVFGEPQVTLEQTGGMCMVIQVAIPSVPTHYCWITCSYDESDEGEYVVGLYERLIEEDELQDSTEVYQYSSLSALPEVILHQLNNMQGATS